MSMNFSLKLFFVTYVGLLSLFSLVPAALAEQAVKQVTVNDNHNHNSELALDELRAFVNAFSQIRKTYVEKVDDKVLLENAIKGMLYELDPHSNYLEPQSYEDLQINSTGEFGGLGIEVGMEDGFVKVISPIDDTPAAKAGLESGDLIVKIDNKPIKGLSLNDAIKLMRGKVGTKINLSVLRKNSPQPIEFTLTRDIIAVKSVRKRIIDENYLYLRIAQFQINTGNDLVTLIEKAETKQTINGIILDLRNNPGGVLQAAVDVTDAFIDEGLIVYTEGRIKESQTRFEASNDSLANKTPLVVLINGGSASASEIVAGALQDHKRAVILGTTSFGKGSVQSVVPLSETHGIKLTTARYFTPNGRSIQAQGIVPDIIIERSKITKVGSFNGFSEADLVGHLANGEQENDSSKQQIKNDDKDNDLVSDDAQLFEAVNLLKGLHILEQNRKAQTVEKNIETTPADKSNS